MESCHWDILLRIFGKPRKQATRLTVAPRAGQLFWCDFSNDAHLPEFYKTRPVIILSHRNTLHGRCLVIPVSTAKQSSKWSMPISKSLEHLNSWAVCEHIYTVAVSRLHKSRTQGIVQLDEKEFGTILGLAHAQFPLPRNADGSP